MNCPKCKGVKLNAMVVDEVEVDRCPDCHGIWFDRAELGQLLDRSDSRVEDLMSGEDEEDSEAQDALHGVCPRDGAALLRVHSARNHTITMDSCFQCQGLWLDGGEFARIKTAQPNLRLGDFV